MPRKLPPHPQLMDEFLAGATYATLAKKYGVKEGTTVYVTLRKDCRQNDIIWPLIPQSSWNVRSMASKQVIDPTGILLLLDMHLEEHGLTLFGWCKKHGLGSWVRHLYHHQGERKITPKTAIRLLEAMDEPIPARLRRAA